MPIRARSIATRLAAATCVAAAAACADHTSPAPEPAAPSAPLLAARDVAYTTLDVTGALLTSPQGINARGDVTGFYLGIDNVVHGFVWSGGVVTSFDVPGAAGTQARGIGPSGEIVGSYWRPGEPGVAAHGFRRSAAGDITTFDNPGHLYTIAQRVLPDGTILGCRHDNDTMASMVGVTYAPEGVSEIGAFASMNNGATPDGRRVVGLYTNMMTNRGEAYIIDDGVFTSYMVPTSIMTAAWDVNPRGDVAGVYRNASGFHGFVLSGDAVTTFDFPGATATRVFGINAAGAVVGTYVAAGKTHGFVAR